MSGQLLLINPRKRRAGGKRRTAAQRAATARLVAMNKSRRRNPAKRTAAKRRAAPVATVARRRTRSTVAKRRSAPRKSSGAALNFSVNGLMKTAKQAGIAAGGAVAVDYAFGMVKSYLPVSMQSPADAAGAMNPLYFLGKGLLAVAVGVFGSRFMGRDTAAAMAQGSLAVTAYTALRGVMPASIAANLGYYSPATNASLRPPSIANVTDLRAYLSAQGSNAARGTNRAYDNPGMSAYLSRG